MLVRDRQCAMEWEPGAGEQAPAVLGGGRTGCLGRLVQVLLFAALIAIAFVGQLWAWGGAILGGEVNPAAVTAIQSLAALAVLLPFAAGWRAGRERAIYRMWWAAALYPLLLAATRLLPPTQSQAVLLLQLVLTLLFAAVLAWPLRRRRVSQVIRSTTGGAAAGAGLLALPWVLFGALGSPEDLLLALLLGLAFGAAAALLVLRLWLPSLELDSRGRGADIFTGGLAAGAALVTMASGLSLNGLQLVLMVALPALSWLAVALFYTSPPAGVVPAFDWRPPALLLGLSSATILAFTDAGPLALEAGDAALGWAWRAAGISVASGWLWALMALLLRLHWGTSGQEHPVFGRVVWGGALLSAALAVLLYFVAGQPGFYGDRLFVILNTQADLSPAVQMRDYDARRQYVYRTAVAHADAGQAGLRRTFEQFGIPYTPYYLVSAIEVDGSLLARLLLANRSEVSRVLPSPRLRPLPGSMEAGQQEAELPPDHGWNLALIGAEQVWAAYGARGAGIVVGQSDSGVDGAHVELADAYRGRGGSDDYNWFDPWSHTPAPVDYGGHGTHTLGSVLGNNTGVAPDATWIACANLQRNLGNPALYLDCLQFMLAPFPQDGDPLHDGDPLRSAHVLNNSWGCPEDHEGCDPASLQPAVDALRAAGIFVVASAGNDGPRCGTVTDPIATYAGAFTVGAVDAQRNLAFFSSAGPVMVDGSGRTKPDIAAPGVDVWSAYPGGQYAMFSGTSMAGPHVAGAVALLWSADPTLIGDIDRTERILRETARPFSGEMMDAAGLLVGEESPVPQPAATPNPGAVLLDVGLDSQAACIRQASAGQTPNNLVGYGIVDVYAAVQRALKADE